MDEQVKQKLLEADQLAAKGEVDNAIAAYEAIITMDPRNAEAFTKLAGFYETKGLKDKAAEKYLFLADAYYDSRLYKGALKYYQKVIELNPEALEARIKAAEIYVVQDMEREAKIEYLVISELCLKNNDLARAEEFCKKSIGLKSIEAHYLLGQVYYTKEMWSEAANEFGELLRFKPNHSQALYHLAMADFKAHKIPEAIATCEKVLKANPGDVMIRQVLASAFLQKGDQAEAMREYLGCADQLMQVGKLDDAGEIYQKIFAFAPNDLEARNRAAALYEKSGNTAAAVKEYMFIAELYGKGKLDTDKQRAREALQKVLAIDPGSKEAMEKLSQMGVDVSAPPPARLPVEEKPAPAAAGPAEPEPEAPAPAPAPVKEVTAAKAPAKEKEEEHVAVSDAKLLELDSEELSIMADNHMKQGFFEKALEIFRILKKREPRNPVINKKMHEIYRLIDLQVEEVSDRTAPRVGAAAGEEVAADKKAGRSRISYL